MKLAGLILCLLGAFAAGRKLQTGEESLFDTLVAANTEGEYQGQFDILAAAVTAVPEITQALQNTTSDQDITIFAPTDDAFEAAGITEDSLADVDASTIIGILSYHTVLGAVPSSELANLSTVETVFIDTPAPAEGEAELDDEQLEFASLTVTPTEEGGLGLTDAEGGTATVLTPDIQASNGVIHVIDSVLLRFPLPSPGEGDAAPAAEEGAETPSAEGGIPV